VSDNNGLNPKVRDSVLLSLGTFMLLLMTWRERVDPWLVGAALACLGTPPGWAAIKLYRGKTDTQSTPDSSSPSAASSLPPSGQ